MSPTAIRPIFGYLTLFSTFALALIPRPPTDNSVRAISETQDDNAQRYKQFQKQFGADEVVIVHVKTTSSGQLVRVLRQVKHIFSEFSPIQRTLNPGKLFQDVLSVAADPELSLDIKTQANICKTLRGPLNRSLKLLKLDCTHPFGTSAHATIYAFGHLASPEVWKTLHNKLTHLQSSAPRGTQLLFGGTPFLNLALNNEGERVEQTVIPLLGILCTLILFGTLRNIRISLCVLAAVGLGILSSEGIYSVLGLSSNLIVNVAKPLLFVILLASALHVAIAFEYHLSCGFSRSEAAWLAMVNKMRGLSLALLTTTVGFSSLMLADLAPIRHLGIFVTTGLIVGGFLLLFGLPTLLSHFGPKSSHQGTKVNSVLEKLLVRAISRCFRYKRIILTVTALLIGLGGFSFTKLTPKAHPLAFFPTDHPITQSYSALDSHGVGLMTLEGVITPLPSEATLKTLDLWISTATASLNIRGRLDFPLLIREANWRSTQSDKVPDSAYTNWLVKNSDTDFSPVRDQDTYRVAFLLNPTISALKLTQLRQELRALQSQILPSADLTLTGNFDLMVRSQLRLQETLLRSFLMTLIIMEIILGWALRSIRLALIALVPNILPLATNALLMYILDLPIDVGTTMTWAVALGIAVDDTLHFLVAWKDEGSEAAILRTGRALVVSTLVISCGFFALISSEFIPTRNFALLTGSSMVVALLGDLFVLPLLLNQTDAKPS